MSLVPMFQSWLVGCILVSLFMWRVGLALLVLAFTVWFLVGVLGYAGSNIQHQGAGFWLFILSEVMVFGTLFFYVRGFEASQIGLSPLSSFHGIPLVCCFLLLGSSITATAFHHNLGLGGSNFYLVCTLLLGACFVGAQLYEFHLCEFSWSDGAFYSVCFCIVGLHFSHVVLGLLGFLVFFKLQGGVSSYLQLFYASVVVWYWHFVDYVWLLVYTLVYLC
uniref:Cytochrome c oxidase subunit 3 n=1 Tax=Azygia robusta TaxID=3062496 RepID=A0AA50ZM33_9TREM|nr:cytochrome c oxidase subunit III [Azygia robusta]WMH04195.1 cytochrome c oxidase subunit III [Azygia robusta]WMH04207.1 cytochrome c oxidase subunit III [Azygia robusta]